MIELYNVSEQTIVDIVYSNIETDKTDKTDETDKKVISFFKEIGIFPDEYDIGNAVIECVHIGKYIDNGNYIKHHGLLPLTKLLGLV